MKTMLQENDIQAVEKLHEAYRLITEQLARVIVGQQQVIEELLVAMFARGHCLLVGVPGLAKTLMIRTLADALSLEFSRIQFTPDLMPSDITGTEVIQEDKLTGSREFKFLRGPIFANVILADEINRTPPKTQAALLEAMQEHQVTVGGKRHRLDRAVLRAGHAEPHRAGRHLPAAGGPAGPLHVQHLRRLSQRGGGVPRSSGGPRPTSRPRSTRTLSAEEILGLQRIVRRVPVADHVIRYAVQLRAADPAAAGPVPGLRPGLRHLGRGSAGEPVPGPGGQGPGRAARPLLRRQRGRARPWPTPCCGIAS